MRSIAEKGRGAATPMAQRPELIERPAAPALGSHEQAPGRFCPPAECGEQLRRLRGSVPGEALGDGPVPMWPDARVFDHRNDIQVLAATHGIMDEVGASPEPKADDGLIEGRPDLGLR